MLSGQLEVGLWWGSGHYPKTLAFQACQTCSSRRVVRAPYPSLGGSRQAVPRHPSELTTHCWLVKAKQLYLHRGLLSPLMVPQR